MSTNHIKNIALIGAGGHCGRHIAQSLLATGKFNLTALTRAGSTSTLPASSHLSTVTIDYTSHASLVSALTGQDVLIITLSAHAPKDTQSKLIAAAAEAHVAWVLPNEWCPDLSDAGLVRDVPWFGSQHVVRKEIQDAGLGYIAVATGFWYEWMLGMGAYGFAFQKREVTFFDDGDVRISNSTWPQVGRAVAALLSLPVKAEEGGNKEGCLESLRNSVVAVSSFEVSQKDMFESMLRVTGTKEEDWKVGRVSTKERFEEGAEALRQGNFKAAAGVSARVFYPDGCGNFEDRSANKLLGLPKEDLDPATKIAIERSVGNPYA